MKAFLTMFNEADFMLLYDQQKSYMWKHRPRIVEAIQQIQQKDLYQKCKTIDQFLQYQELKQQ